MTTGKKHFEFTIHCLFSLRYILQVELPIEIVYNGEDDLPASNRAILRQFPEIQFVNLEEELAMNTSLIQGWSIKPFAMLASSFEEIMFIDSDVLFTKNPTFLFEDEKFKETGTMFFKDRAIWKKRGGATRAAQRLIPYPMESVEQLRIWNDPGTDHEMESGVLLLNKKTPAFQALLLNCRLNMIQERQFMYERFHGDKEVFWISHEILRIPYSFVGGYAGNIGYMQEGWHCGSVAHTYNEELLWWNNGVLANKESSMDTFMEMNEYSMDVAEPGSRVLWKLDSNPFCLQAPQGTEYLKVKQIDAHTLKLIAIYRGLWKKIRGFKESESSIYQYVKSLRDMN